jgi:hypothetical protein
MMDVIGFTRFSEMAQSFYVSNDERLRLKMLVGLGPLWGDVARIFPEEIACMRRRRKDAARFDFGEFGYVVEPTSHECAFTMLACIWDAVFPEQPAIPQGTDPLQWATAHFQTNGVSLENWAHIDDGADVDAGTSLCARMHVELAWLQPSPRPVSKVELSPKQLRTIFDIEDQDTFLKRIASGVIIATKINTKSYSVDESCLPPNWRTRLNRALGKL